MAQDDPEHAQHPHAVDGGDGAGRHLGVHDPGSVADKGETQEESLHQICRWEMIVLSTEIWPTFNILGHEIVHFRQLRIQKFGLNRQNLPAAAIIHDKRCRSREGYNHGQKSLGLCWLNTKLRATTWGEAIARNFIFSQHPSPNDLRIAMMPQSPWINVAVSWCLLRNVYSWYSNIDLGEGGIGIVPTLLAMIVASSIPYTKRSCQI